MKRVQLLPKTLRGKNIVRVFGDTWGVKVTEDKVQCLNNEAGMLLVRGVNTRWVKVNGDADFDVEVL